MRLSEGSGGGRLRRALLLALGCLCGSMPAPTARAGSYPEQGRPAYLGMGGATFAGGAVDAATGAPLLPLTLGQIKSPGGVPVVAGLLWKGQDGSVGPCGIGWYMAYDWFLQPIQSGTSYPCELVGPGNRRYAFNQQLYPYNEWIDPRDPEMAGAVVIIPDPPYSDHRNWIAWKDGSGWSFDGYGSQGLLSVTDARGNPIINAITRDEMTGIATQVQLAPGAGGPARNIYYHRTWPSALVDSITISYDGSTTGSIDRTWSLSYTTVGYGSEIASITDPTGGTTHLTWTTYTRDDGALLPLLLTLTNPRGNLVYQNQYDGLGRVVKQTYADSGYLTASYPAGGIGATGETVVTDPRGGVRSYGCVWEPAVNGRLEGYHLANFTDPLGRTTQWDQLHAGSYLDTRVTDYRGRLTTLNWDFSKANLLSRSWTTPAQATATESWSYNPSSFCVTATDALGGMTSATVDSGGAPLSVTDALSHTTSATRDGYGNATAVTNALNQTSTLTYGPYSELLASTDPLNHTTTRTYDAASQLLSVQDANGKQVSFTYDKLGRLLTSSQTVNGQVLTTTNVYDADGNRVQMTDPKGQVWQWSFDSMDRVETETDPTGHSATTSYDLNSNVSVRTDRDGNSVAVTYDAENRPLTQTFTQPGGAPDSTVTYQYDPTTHLLTSCNDTAPGAGTCSFTYDSLDRLTAAQTPAGTLNYTLDDKLNRRTGLLVPNQSPIAYGYDAAGELTSIAQGAQTTTVCYDPLGRLCSQTLGNGVTTTWSFDAAGYLSSLVSTSGSTTLDSHTYTRDAVGNATQEVIGGLSSFTSAFGFDDLYRPTSATDPTGTYAWSYDADNNRLSQTVNGVTAAYTVDAANRLTSVGGVPVTTDANGNILVDNTGQCYQWDARGRLTSVSRNGTSLASYTYATNGVRSSMTEGGVTTTFTLDGGMCVNEAAGGVNTPTLFGPTGPLERGGQWFTPDASGSVATVTGSSGNAIAQNCYGVFGQVMSTNPSSGDPLQYLGGMAEPSTGLDALDSGFYEPDLGRMLSGSTVGAAVGGFVHGVAGCVGHAVVNLVNSAANAANPLGGGPVLNAVHQIQHLVQSVHDQGLALTILDPVVNTLQALGNFSNPEAAGNSLCNDVLLAGAIDGAVGGLGGGGVETPPVDTTPPAVVPSIAGVTPAAASAGDVVTIYRAPTGPQVPDLLATGTMVSDGEARLFVTTDLDLAREYNTGGVGVAGNYNGVWTTTVPADEYAAAFQTWGEQLAGGRTGVGVPYHPYFASQFPDFFTGWTLLER